MLFFFHEKTYFLRNDNLSCFHSSSAYLHIYDFYNGITMKRQFNSNVFQELSKSFPQLNSHHKITSQIHMLLVSDERLDHLNVTFYESPATL